MACIYDISTPKQNSQTKNLAKPKPTQNIQLPHTTTPTHPQQQNT